jgi:hypothetical protein
MRAMPLAVAYCCFAIAMCFQVNITQAGSACDSRSSTGDDISACIDQLHNEIMSDIEARMSGAPGNAHLPVHLSATVMDRSTVVEAPKDTPAPSTKPRIPDRVGQPSSSDQVAPMAQRVVLYDEDPSDPKGKQYVGSVIWRTEQVKAAAGQKPDTVVRADIDIPDRKFKMAILFRRNTDTFLPASHTAELTFTLAPDFAGGGISNVPGILMKSNEQAGGTPLVGLAVKVTDSFFLVGLSNVEVDRAGNLQLMKERSWFDVPLVYVNQRKAIIAIEKGSPGERAFNDAFAAWGGR